MIETQNLTKTFGSFTAVRELTLSVRPGEIYGLLGPNGAGKTTTLMLILGILSPTAGEVRIFGERLDANSFDVKSRLGVMAERPGFYDDMTAWEHLLFYAQLYRARNTEPRIRRLLEQVNLWEWRDALVGSYSTGMRRKLSLVCALVHAPDVLILDEPVANLDPYGIVQIREILDQERARGCAILASSHILSEVERTANRVGIIVGGELLVEDTMDNLRGKVVGKRQIRVDVVSPVNGLVRKIEQLPWVLDARQEGTVVDVFTANDRDYRADLGRFLFEQQAIVQEMRAIEASLEEAFITLTEARVRAMLEQDNG
jgi:ABC-type multidrug transport system ATPase subunit